MDNHDSAKKAVNEVGHELPAEGREITPADYLQEMKVHISKGRQRDAFTIMQQAYARFPDDPVILSFFGWLQAVADNKSRTGVESCKSAIVLLRKTATPSEWALYPALYLNLGRAYLAAEKKKDAIDAFQTGLRYNKINKDLLKEMAQLGTRKPVLVPFLDRSNPVNIIAGKLLPAQKKKLGRGK